MSKTLRVLPNIRQDYWKMLSMNSPHSLNRTEAFRLVMNLLRNSEDVKNSGGIIKLHEIHYCRVCNNISDDEICSICDDKRDKTIICVVEVQDVMAIENTHQFKGVYHVLGGIISLVDGIGPRPQIDSLRRGFNQV